MLFRNVIGVDPSSKMVEQANETFKVGVPDQVHFVQSAAESLPFIKDDTVDLIVSGPR